MASGTILYVGSKFEVRRRLVQDQTGQSRPLDYVVHPGACVILPILPDGRVVLIQTHRFAPDRDLLELPAGCLEPGEPPIECARREIAEETGYRATEMRPLAQFYSSPGLGTELMHAFLATGLTPGPTAHEPLEFIHVRPMEYADALAAAGDGRIIDGKTLATLLYYDRFVRAPR